MENHFRLDRHHIGRNIRQLRELEGLSLTGLSELLNPHGLRMTKATLSKIEGGSRQVTAEELPLFALALNSTPNRILIGELSSDTDTLTLSDHVGPRPVQRVWSWAEGEFPLIDPEYTGDSGGDEGLAEAQVKASQHLREYTRRNRPHRPTPSDPDALRGAMETHPTALPLAREAVRQLALAGFFTDDIHYVLREEVSRARKELWVQQVSDAAEAQDTERLRELGIEFGIGPVPGEGKE